MVKKHILVVDDCEVIRQLIREALINLKQVDIIESNNGISALEILEEQNIKIILTDIEMPGMSGIEFVSEVRKKGLNTPVIFISGEANMELAIQALKLGAFDFIEKPFRGDDILTTVTKALKTQDSVLLTKLEGLNLNSTQIKILEMLMKGLSNKEIAGVVKLSEQGVKYHVGNLFKRFDTNNRGELRDKIWVIVTLN
jgi:DNA-binding NarL/FixJ family response regulator